MIENVGLSTVFEDLVNYVAKNGVKESIKPVFKTDDFALYNGDCLEIMSRLFDNYVNMVFADPPYMLSNDGFSCQNGRMVSVNKGNWDKSKGFDEDLDFHETWLKEDGMRIFSYIYSLNYFYQSTYFSQLHSIRHFNSQQAHRRC